MNFLWQSLQAGGSLTLASNIESYISEFYAGAKEIWGITERSLHELKNPTCYRSHFEKKYLERGEKCQEVVLTKK